MTGLVPPEELARVSTSLGSLIGQVRGWNDDRLLMTFADKLVRYGRKLANEAQRHAVDPDLHRLRARHHAAERAWERFRLPLSTGDLHAIDSRIWKGEAIWVADLKARSRQAYELVFHDRRMVAVFDIRLGCVVTFVPDASWLGDRLDDDAPVDAPIPDIAAPAALEQFT